MKSAPFPPSRPPRNSALVDVWSLVHFSTGVLLGWIMPPWLAIGLMILWEPLEIFVLSPLLWRRHIVFGYETWRNSLSDIVVDSLGVLCGYLLTMHVIAAPFHIL